MSNSQQNYYNMRIKYNTSSPDSLKVVLFRNSGYGTYDEHNISGIVTHTDTTVKKLTSSETGSMDAPYTVQSGQPFTVTFRGVTHKDAWIGLFQTGTAGTSTPASVGMWCYTATAKQWSISDSSRIVNSGKVKLSANQLNAVTGQTTPLAPGQYILIMYRGGDYDDDPLAMLGIVIK